MIESPGRSPRRKRRRSGEIRVFIQRGEVADVVSDARAQFERLGMTKTRERNAVLIFVCATCPQIRGHWRQSRV